MLIKVTYIGDIAESVSNTQWSNKWCLVCVRSFKVPVKSLFSSIILAADCLNPDIFILLLGDSWSPSLFIKIFFAMAKDQVMEYRVFQQESRCNKEVKLFYQSQEQELQDLKKP